MTRAKREKGMNAPEVAIEAKWLLEGGVDPAEISSTLRKSIPAIARTVRRHGDPEVAKIFESREKTDRTYYKNRRAA